MIAPARGVREIPVCTNQRRLKVECRHNREASMKALIAGLPPRNEKQRQNLEKFGNLVA